LNSTNWMRAATLFVQVGDLDGFRRAARATLKHFAGSIDAGTAERTAKVGLLLSSPETDLTRLTALADLAVPQGADSTRGFLQSRASGLELCHN
jgi:hypothetical protein